MNAIAITNTNMSMLRVNMVEELAKKYSFYNQTRPLFIDFLLKIVVFLMENDDFLMKNDDLSRYPILEKEVKDFQAKR